MVRNAAQRPNNNAIIIRGLSCMNKGQNGCMNKGQNGIQILLDHQNKNSFCYIVQRIHDMWDPLAKYRNLYGSDRGKNPPHNAAQRPNNNGNP